MYYINKTPSGYQGLFSTNKEPSTVVDKEFFCQADAIIWIIIRAWTVNQDKIGYDDIQFKETLNA